LSRSNNKIKGTATKPSSLKKTKSKTVFRIQSAKSMSGKIEYTIYFPY